MYMDTIISSIREYLETLEDGSFIPLVKLAQRLPKEVMTEIKAKNIKLKKVIEEAGTDIFDLAHDEHGLPKVRLIRNEPKNNLNRASYTKVKESACEYEEEGILQLYRYAYIPEKLYVQLAENALPEKWTTREEGSKDYSPLKNYLQYTFVKLWRENSVYEAENDTGEKYACFNTGLVDKLYRNIYALFGENLQKGRQQYFCYGFYTEGTQGNGKLIVQLFNPLPPPAHYFDNPADLLYYPLVSPHVDWEHIVVDNVKRLPQEFLADELRCNVEDLPSEDSLKTLIKGNHVLLRRITSRLQGALDVALKRVSWNYKTAIPMYYPRGNKLTLLLPLSLLQEEVVDIALVVERLPNRNFLGHTILSLEDAYNNARLIARPDSDWLSAE